ncbi:UNVERIFIED_CONTAM: hypothetical protein PYX00_008987 [Menopon gallinae]|uniref:FAM13A-like domain-containing protein n=1 Tax=Menopon gallinae TaxID=328185 RepID=A0AAW2H9K3_9NEOP
MGALIEAGKTESRLSKVKRIITGTILLGRKARKESVHPQTEQEDQENSPDFAEKGKDPAKMKIEDQFHKCNSVKGQKTKSSAKRYDENMDTENIQSKGEISVCLGKDHGKTLKEITIEITKNAPSVTTEILLKPRKRKERLDSGGSVKQDNKVIRSSSEERAEDSEGKNKELNIRRVSSHEDFSRVRVLQEVNSIQPPKDAGDGKDAKEFTMEEMFHNAEEIEHERRRSCERFSRAVAPARGRRTMQKRKPKTSKKKTGSGGDTAEADSQENGQGSNNDISDRGRSPSPSSSPPALDISTLHKQMEGSEPITSRGKILSPEDEPESPTIEALISPRNSLVMRLSHLDPSLPPSPPRDHNIRHGSHESQERRLSKQINSIKRQLKKYEDGFQQEFGYRPSHADKQANKDIKKLCSELNKYRAQLKQIKEDNAAFLADSSGKPLSFLTSLEGSNHNSSPSSSKHSKSNKTMEEVLQEVEKRLQEKRQQSGRSSEISEMSRGDLLEEKVAVQKALLHLENVFGRPVTREDRDLVRPLYQRYRSLKRLVVRSSGGKLNNSTGELATILEHETMEFTTSPSSSFDIGEGASSAPEGLNLATSSEVSKKTQPDDVQNSSSSSDSLGENLHALPLSQLLEQQKTAREEKKKLRRNLREFEDSFRSETGRRAQKQDRIVIEGIYVNYKQIKAKLRLLDALIAKKSCVKRNSC